MTQLHPFRLLQTGRERIYRKHRRKQPRFHECLGLLAHQAHLAWCSRPRIRKAAIPTMEALFPQGDRELGLKSARSASRRGKQGRQAGLSPAGFCLPLLTQIQKSLVLQTMHLFRSNRGCLSL